ncbi:glucose 1-dehydrogenase [Thioclava litoralis]|uniref:Glucose 1-dehydrogenase n=1 Tax=Thioclava litoralis TaxID=3076557 RepID=A0ABZ1E0F2_9RHOB|nr:glucose 1-dehydrogenase [Thioclava sp. FTW29]
MSPVTPQPTKAANRLKGKIAIVTGGSSGIGAAIAETYAQEGADLVITYRSDEEGARKTADHVAAHGSLVEIVKCDLSKLDDIEALFAKTQDRFGAADILVNNGGMDPDPADLDQMDPEDWSKVIAVNLTGPAMASAAFTRMRKAAGGGGRIVTVSSVHENVPRGGTSAYDASKGGLRMLTRTLALELAPHRITANNILPGMILTPINQEAIDDPELRKEMESHIPWGRAGQPWEVAKMAVYLASTDAEYVTGQSFAIDGGLSINLGQGA